MYGADHIDGDHHVYSLFYGISNVPVTNTRMLKIFYFVKKFVFIKTKISKSII
jgi:hypothetical protein